MPDGALLRLAAAIVTAPGVNSSGCLRPSQLLGQPRPRWRLAAAWSPPSPVPSWPKRARMPGGSGAKACPRGRNPPGRQFHVSGSIPARPACTRERQVAGRRRRCCWGGGRQFLDTMQTVAIAVARWQCEDRGPEYRAGVLDFRSAHPVRRRLRHRSWSSKPATESRYPSSNAAGEEIQGGFAYQDRAHEGRR